MKERFKSLLFNQTAQKIRPYTLLQKEVIPVNGWIATIRTSIGMTMKQLGKKLGKTAQAVNQIQKREQEGSITLNSLQEVAQAMGMKVVYAIIPVSGNLEDYIRKFAEKKAKDIVSRTNNSMLLEQQEVEQTRLNKSISELTNEFVNNPERLWD